MKFTHTLVCDNQSPADTQFCLYQRVEKTSGTVSLAWICQTCAPGAKTVFRWSEELHFVWGYAQSLKPGENIFTVQTVPVQDGEHVRLIQQQNGNYTFQSAAGSTPLIQTDGSVPAFEIAVGLGMKAECMCDTAALMVQAGPNGRYPFDTEVEYYLGWNAACSLQCGDVLDLDAIDSQKIKFPVGRTKLNARLDESNKVTVFSSRSRSAL